LDLIGCLQYLKKRKPKGVGCEKSMIVTTLCEFSGEKAANSSAYLDFILNGGIFLDQFAHFPCVPPFSVA
jgi:hypothetical protein